MKNKLFICKECGKPEDELYYGLCEYCFDDEQEPVYIDEWID